MSLRKKYENWKSRRQDRSLSPRQEKRKLLRQFQQSLKENARKSQYPQGVNSVNIRITVSPGGSITLGNTTIYNNLTTSWHSVVIDTIGGTVLQWIPLPAPPVAAIEPPTLTPPIERVDQPLVGFRAFYVRLAGREWDVMGHLRAKDVRLSAINMQFGDWRPGVNEGVHWPDQPYGAHGLAAQPGHHPHIVPASNCMCGFWSLHGLPEAIAKVRWPSKEDFAAGQFTHIPVVGVIQGWGRVREHLDGYRFQYASVVALTLVEPPAHVTAVAYDFAEETVRRICRQFDVPFVASFEKLVDLKLAEEQKLDGG